MLSFKPKLFTRKAVLALFVLVLFNTLAFSIAAFFSQLSKTLNLPKLVIASNLFLFLFSWFGWSLGRKKRLRRLVYSLIVVTLTFLPLKRFDFVALYFMLNTVFATVLYPVYVKVEKWKTK